MKNSKVVYIVLILIFTSCTEHKNDIIKYNPNLSYTENIATNIIKIKDTTNYSFLDNLLKNKQIIIIGESSHYEITGYKIRNNLVSYLVDKLKFNTYSYESVDFISYSLSNILKKSGNNVERSTRTRINKILSEPEKYLRNLTCKNVSFYGFDIYLNGNSIYLLKEVLRINFPSIYENYSWVNIEYFANIYFDGFSNENGTRSKYRNNKNLDYISNSDRQYYIDFINNVSDNFELLLSKDPNNKTLNILKQCMYNLKFQYIYTVSSEKSPINIICRLRDEQIANNIIWYIDHNPNAKIVISVHNVHANKAISNINIISAEEEYTGFQMMAEYLVNKYGNKVYVMGFTSYHTKGFQVRNNSITNESLEYILNKNKVSLGFINFNTLKKNLYYGNEKFKASFNVIEGHANWLNIFDGMYYINDNSVYRDMLTLKYINNNE